jgi:hypothetical protein
MRGYGLTDEELTNWVTQSRARQGLPPTIVDPNVLQRIAAAAGLTTDRNDPTPDAGAPDATDVGRSTSKVQQGGQTDKNGSR